MKFFSPLSKHLRGAAASFMSTSWLLLLRKAFHRTDETENVYQNDYIAVKIQRSSYGMHIRRDIDVDVDRMLKRWDGSGHKRIHLAFKSTSAFISST